MKYGKYYKIPPELLKNVLESLDTFGFKWYNSGRGLSISKYLHHSLNFNLENPVLEIEIYKGVDTGTIYKSIILTSEELLKSKANSKEIYSYEQFLNDINESNLKDY